MITLVMLLGALLVVGVPISAGTLLIWFGLNNPDTGIGKLVYKYWPFGKPTSVQEKERLAEKAASAHLRRAARMASMEERLRIISVSQFLTIMGEQLDLAAFIKLLELQYFGTDKSDKVHISPRGERLREFLWYTLGDRRIITEIPIGEGKRLCWLIGEDVTDKVDVALAAFMAGEPGDPPGPAKKFAQSNQSAHIEFRVPGIQGTWEAKDIVWADTEVSGNGRPIGNGARLAMFLSQEVGGENYLLFADLRSGPGSDSLWLLRPFNPDVEIEDIL